MKKSTYTTLLLPVLLFSLPYQAVEMKKEEKRDAPFHLSVKPISLDQLPYEKWPCNNRITYGKQSEYLDSFKEKDKLKKIDEPYLKILPSEKPVNITRYIVKIYSYYRSIEGYKIVRIGIGTIFKKEKGIIYLLTAADSIVMYEEKDPFDPEGGYSSFYAKNISFSYQGKKYPCSQYYIHPKYNGYNERKNIAILISHSGYELNFPYTIFPEMVIASPNRYKGFITAYESEGKRSEKVELVIKNLNVSRGFTQYDNTYAPTIQSGSATWASINGVYKIIGIHTIIDADSAVCISQDIIDWEKACWLKTKEIYGNIKDFDSNTNNDPFETILNDQDQREKIERLYLKIQQKEKPVDITKYLVRLHTDYGIIRNKEVSGEATAIIIKIKKNIILLLTCAHNLVKYLRPIDDNPFIPPTRFIAYYVRNIAFSYNRKKYLCTNFWVHPKYSMSNQSKDIGLVVSDRGCALNFPYTIFPEIATLPSGLTEGYIIGFPGEKEGDLYGMYGKLSVNSTYIKYKITTSKGQSGSPIWVQINDIYKIIGVHTIKKETLSNYGVVLNQTVINWIKKSWFKTQHMQYRE